VRGLENGIRDSGIGIRELGIGGGGDEGTRDEGI